MPLTFTDKQYPLFRNSFDARPTAVTVAFETIDIQEQVDALQLDYAHPRTVTDADHTDVS